LANHLTKSLNITYHEALETIDRFSFALKNQLTQGKKIEIHEVGFLNLDVEKNIQFSPSQIVNYLHQAYGLTSFQSSAIQRNDFKVPFEIKFKDRPSIKPETKRKSNRAKYLIPLAILPVAALLFLWPFGVLNDTFSSQLSGYFGAKPVEKNLYNPAISHHLELAQSEPFVLNETTFVASEVISNSIAPAETTAVATVEKVAATNTPISDGYYIIAGCFALRENAEKQIQLLASKNISASITGQNKNGLYRVSCGTYSNAADANQAINEIKPNNPDVWLLKL
jgi:hypothetical protein